jgi:hypothetical protein
MYGITGIISTRRYTLDMTYARSATTPKIANVMLKV